MPPIDTDLLALLEERGFVHQSTDADGLRAALARGPLTAYLGFDATADSLHVGHLQGLMLMRWLQHAGHRPLLLIGGATTRIGDPSFRDSSRPMLDEATIAANMRGIASAFQRYLRLGDGAADARVVNNADWLDGLGYLAQLRGHAEPEIAAIPVVFLTADKQQETVVSAKQLKVDGYLVKPVSLVALKQRLDPLLKFHHLI